MVTRLLFSADNNNATVKIFIIAAIFSRAFVAFPPLGHFPGANAIPHRVVLPQGLKIPVPVADVPHDPRVVKQPIAQINEAPSQKLVRVVDGGTLSWILHVHPSTPRPARKLG